MKNQAVKKASKDVVSTEIVVSALQQKAAPIFNKLKRIESINTQQDLDKAGEQTKLLKELKKESTAQKKSMTDGLEQSLKAIRAHFKPFESKVDEAEEEIKVLIKEYYDKQDRLLSKIEQDFEEGKIKKVDTYAAKVSEAQIVGSKNGASRRVLTKLFIIDESKIPRQYMMPDEALIEAALKDGKKIPGAELRKINSVAI